MQAIARHASLTLLSICLATGGGAVAVNIGGAKQLLIDDHIIHSLGGAQRVFKQGEKLGPLLSANSDWERKRSIAYPTVRWESAGDWRMWYRAGTTSGERAIGYATSTDGIHWTKPHLGIYPHNDGNNNIVRWNGNDNLANCAGQEVVLQIHIPNAALYSLDFTPDATHK